MSDRDKTRLVLADFSGGRNGADAPLGKNFRDTQVVDAVNVDWYRTTGARKRWGASLLDTSTTTGFGQVTWMTRHVPGVIEADAELWILKSGSPPPAIFQRLDNSTTWTAPAITDTPIPASTHVVSSASLHGKLFLAYQSAVNRLHVYDPALNRIRRTGITPGSNPPTVANQGAGAYPAVLRYYRVRWNDNGIANVFSEATASVGITPSGAGAAIRVTRPTAPGESETLWQIEVSTDNITFYILGALPIATTFFDDTSNPAAYATVLELAPFTGTFTLQKSYRLIASDQNRLIGWGSWDAGDKQNRLEISAIVGSLDQGDAERVDGTTNYFIDFDELDSGPPVALVGPVWDRFYCFKTHQMFELIPTGSIDQPYRRIKISAELGCVGPHAACRGEDANGAPCLYIMTHRGLYRYGLNGFQSLGRGIEDLVLGPTSRINADALLTVAHVVHYPDLNQLWVWFATGSAVVPTVLCVLDIAANGGLGAWSRYTGTWVSGAQASVMFSDSIGATMGSTQVPYVSFGVGLIVKGADRTATIDLGGVPFQATLTTRPLQVPGFRVATSDVQVLAPAASSVSLYCTAVPDFGASPTVTGVADLTASASGETRVSRTLLGSALASAEFMQFTLGDVAASSSAWSFDRIIVPVQSQEPVTG